MHVTGDQIYIPDPYLGSTLLSNASCYIERKISREHVYTNSRGWRCKDPGEMASASSIAFLGCSWPMGVGVEYEDSFVHKFSFEAGLSAANLGVGSYSLLQAVRRLEREISFVQPRTVILCYGHWLINRCFKSNAMGNIILRPIYKALPNGKLICVEPQIAPITWLRIYTSLKRKESAGQLKFPSRLVMNFLSHLLFLHTRRYGLNKLSNSEYVTQSLGDHYFKMRQIVLSEQIEKLHSICKGNNANLLIFHLYQYISKSKEDIRCIDEDTDFLKRYCNTNKGIIYEGSETMANILNGYIQSLQDPESFLNTIHLHDNNHPSAKGHSLIAEALNIAYAKINS